jgi:hypothetical protein
MKSPRSEARRSLRRSIERVIFPELEKRGFKLLRLASKSPPIWAFHRARYDGGFDVIDLIMKTGNQPLFDACINVIPKAGISRSWDGAIPAKEAMASDLPERIAIARKIIHNRTIRALARWVGVSWFGFKGSGNQSSDENLAIGSCDEFISTLDQAEAWWKANEVGPNLIKEVIGVIHH